VYGAERQTPATNRMGFPLRKLHPEVHRHDSRRHSPEFSRVDRLLAANEEPPLGAHLLTPRFAYSHHGVYVGGGTVVHYAAFAKLWARGPVEEVSLTGFADGYAVWLRPARVPNLDGAEVIRRARSRLGENRYRFLSNNCEHLSEWSVNGEHRSPQVERLLGRLRRPSTVLGYLMRWLKAAPPPGGERGFAQVGFPGP
jgi:hypothetical protein